MLLDARDCRLIEAVAQEGTLTRAAVRLNATQPALSRHLMELERRTRLALFQRTARQMVLTPAGERLRLRAREVLAALDKAEAEVRELTGQRKSTLRLTTSCYTAYHWLPRILQRLAVSHPGVEVRIAFEVTRRPVPPLLKGQIDLALVTGLRSNRRIQVRPLFADELVAIVAPEHPWASRRSVNAQDFAGQRLFIVPPPEDSDVITGFLRPAGVKPAEVNELVLTEAMVAMVQAGLGIGALPRWTVSPQLRSGQLVALRLGRGLRRHWGLATLRTHPRSEVIEEFAALIAQPGALEGVV
jgi:LysR family transcriptional regulator, regulator for metE and metH